MRALITSIPVALFLAASPPVSAFKKCVDEAGNVIFTERSCASMGATVVDLPKAAGGGSSTSGTDSGAQTEVQSGASPAGGQSTSRYNQADRARQSSQQYSKPRTLPE